VNREFGPYTADMKWGEPNEGAAVNAMRLIYSYPAYYASLAAGPIRSQVLALLSPESTGNAMKARLQLLHDCMSIVLNKPNDISGEIAQLCLTRILGRRKKISANDAMGLFNMSLPVETTTQGTLTPAVDTLSIADIMDFDDEEEGEEIK
jgi:hypothetical protein